MFAKIRRMASPEDPAARLTALARAEPDRPALISPSSGHSVSFAALEADSDLLARGLLTSGIGPGARAALLVPSGPDYLSLAFALLKVGAVSVVVDPGLTGRRLASSLDRIAPLTYIGGPSVQLGRLLPGRGRRGTRTTAAELRAAAGSGTLPEPDPTAPAMLAVCPGGTAALYRRDQLAGQLDTLARLLCWRPGDVELTALPLLAWLAVAAGVTTVLQRPSSDPARLAALVRAHGVTGLSGSAAMLDRIGRWGAITGARLTSLRRVLSATSPITAEVLSRCRLLLADDAGLYACYGATAALPVTMMDGGELADGAAKLGAGTCVGRPVRGAEVEIVELATGPITAPVDPLPVGTPGEIVVRAPWVSAEYLDDRHTRLTKIPSGDGTFFHRTGDAGYRDRQGRIWFCGRAGERVVAGAETLFTDPCEAVFNTHPAVRRSALVGPRLCGGVRPTICVELNPGEQDSLRLHKDLLDLSLAHEHTRGVRHVLVHRGFPMNAGIDRATLTSWAQRRLR
jgi:acyl-CoA synthetase (AMP-forming)/AMP-acid ligase II